MKTKTKVVIPNEKYAKKEFKYYMKLRAEHWRLSESGKYDPNNETHYEIFCAYHAGFYDAVSVMQRFMQ